MTEWRPVSEIITTGTTQRDTVAGRTAEFRGLEHLWQDHAACDREIHSLNERFGMQYW
jgi:hypothetical protein